MIDEVTTAVNAADTSEKMQSLMESMNKAVLEAEEGSEAKTAAEKKKTLAQAIIKKLEAEKAKTAAEKQKTLAEAIIKKLEAEKAKTAAEKQKTLAEAIIKKLEAEKAKTAAEKQKTLAEAIIKKLEAEKAKTAAEKQKTLAEAIIKKLEAEKAKTAAEKQKTLAEAIINELKAKEALVKAENDRDDAIDNLLLFEIDKLKLPEKESGVENLKEDFQKTLKKEIETTLKYLPLANTWKTQYKPWFNNFQDIPLTDEARTSLQGIETHIENPLVKWLSEKARKNKQLASKLASYFNTKEAANEFSERLTTLNKPLEIIDILNKDGIPVTEKPTEINGRKVVDVPVENNSCLIYSLIATNNQGLLIKGDSSSTANWKDKGAIDAMANFIKAKLVSGSNGQRTFEGGLNINEHLKSIIDILGHFNCINHNETVVYEYDQTDETNKRLCPCLSFNGATPEGTYNALFHTINTDSDKNHGEAMVKESEMDNEKYVTTGWKQYMEEYNRIKNGSEWSENEQRQLNTKLEALLDKEQKQEQQQKPGERPLNLNSNTWWNWKSQKEQSAVKSFLVSLPKSFQAFGKAAIRKNQRILML